MSKRGRKWLNLNRQRRIRADKKRQKDVVTVGGNRGRMNAPISFNNSSLIQSLFIKWKRLLDPKEIHHTTFHVRSSSLLAAELIPGPTNEP